MIIDVHGHITSPPELNKLRGSLLEGRGKGGRPKFEPSDDDVREAYLRPIPHFQNISHMEHLDQGGIDLQLISPRPISQMHSEEPAEIVSWWTEELNNLIHRACLAFPDRFLGVGGMPQSAVSEPKDWLGELRRGVTELGFVGTLINTDPGEGRFPPSPGLGDRYWYPVYEVLCELDVPMFLHSTNCLAPARETYGTHFILEETVGIVTLINSEVMDDFPELKVIVSHGGGAIPFQLGRFESMSIQDVFGPGKGDFFEKLRKIWFDTRLYSPQALGLLFETVGADRCCFGTEKPGTGSQINPRTGKLFDEIKPLIESIEWLSEADRDAIFEKNAVDLFALEGRIKK